MDDTIEFVKEKGYAETLFGRRRYIPELLSGNRQLQNTAQRMAINHPVQGTAADLMKMAMIAVEKKLKAWPKEKQNKVKIACASCWAVRNNGQLLIGSQRRK